MPKTSFTNDNIKKLRISKTKYREVFTQAGVKGLQLTIAWRQGAIRTDNLPAGEIERAYHHTWDFRFQLASGKRSAVRIGEWPAMSAAEAIDTAKTLHGLVKAGEDPRSVILKKRAEVLDAPVSHVPAPMRFKLRNILDSMERDWPSTGKSMATFEKYRRDLDIHVIPKMGERDIRTITGREWDELITDIANLQGKKGAANNVHKAGRRLFAYAVEKEIASNNPLLQRKTVLKSTRLAPDERFLNAQQVHKFLNEIDAQDTPRWVVVYLKLILWLAVRPEEWRRVKIGWIKFNEMRIEHPAESMKGRRVAKTHLPEYVVDLLVEWLTELKERFGRLDQEWYLFPDDNDPKKQQPLKVGEETKKLKNWMEFCPKMLRKTISTHLQRQGCPPVVLRAIRNQAVTEGVEAHYDLDDLYHLKKQWIERWAGLLDQAKDDYTVLLTDRDSQLDSSKAEKVADLFS